MTDSASPSAEPRVAAVVVTYNRKTLLRQCLEALQNQTHPVAEIIVVDNASTDGTAAMVRADFPEVTLQSLEENQGGAGGFHEGMTAAVAQDVDWVWVMDDDAEPAETALEMLFDSGVHSAPDTVALSPLKRFPSGRPQYDQAGWYDPVRAEVEPVAAADEDCTEISYAAFVGLLCRVDVVHRVGLPAADFFLWYDDVEYCLRLASEGRIYLVRSSRVTHHVSEERRSQEKGEAKPWRYFKLSYYWRYYYGYRNRLLILRRHVSSAPQRMRGYARVLFRGLRSAGSVFLYSSHKWGKLQILFWGIVDGLTGRTGKRVDPEHYLDASSE
ncbi:glycosyltransferase family 2 protein [Salinibacter sp. 10B]|uniref:glycosyltransferase family 2 protein n=1 Tax=Salinibacter sp. 10B TaxID=1923971 RepID=UPI000CF54028|nr:glycosyltransferase family 2 protein [Salinibacter sp. 10B]